MIRLDTCSPFPVFSHPKQSSSSLSRFRNFKFTEHSLIHRYLIVIISLRASIPPFAYMSGSPIYSPDIPNRLFRTKVTCFFESVDLPGGQLFNGNSERAPYYFLAHFVLNWIFLVRHTSISIQVFIFN